MQPAQKKKRHTGRIINQCRRVKQLTCSLRPFSPDQKFQKINLNINCGALNTQLRYTSMATMAIRTRSCGKKISEVDDMG